MAVITGLVLILLGTAGARNIPLQEDAPTELPLDLYNLLSDTKTFADTIFPAGELVGRVDEEDHGLHLNKNADLDETVEDHVYNGLSLETDVKENMVTQEEGRDYKEDKTKSMLTSVDTTEVQNIVNIEEGFLEARESLYAGCLPGETRVGNGCVAEDLNAKNDNKTETPQG